MKNHGRVEGNRETMPPNVEINGNTVYVRGDITKELREEEDGRTTVMWTYDEIVLKRTEYDQAKALCLTVPPGMMTDGMRTMLREVRYERMDGPRARCERNIRLHIDEEANQAKLEEIDLYCKAVHEAGLMDEPVWPDEPEVD